MRLGSALEALRPVLRDRVLMNQASLVLVFNTSKHLDAIS